MIDVLSDLYVFIMDIVIGLLNYASSEYWTTVDWMYIDISPGIGQVTWFTIQLQELIGIIIYAIIIITLLHYTIKFVKWIWSFASRLFGGR